MAPLSPDNTPRFRVHYTTVGRQHTMEVRSSSSPAAVGTFLQNFFTTQGAVSFASVIDSVDFAVSGSNVFNPVTTGAEGHTWGSGAGNTTSIPYFINYIGRSTGGRRLRMAVFGHAGAPIDYRYVAGENATVDNTIAVLVAAGGLLTCIDGITPVWKTYANVGFNAYWQRNVRP